MIYNSDTGTWSPFPTATSDGTNFPGSIGSSPYGPSFGSPGGILRAVGSYKTSASDPYDLGYLYDGAAAPGESLQTLVYPSSPGEQTLFTIAHSNFGNTVVGNYDTQLKTGNAFIYDISAGTYTTLDLNRPLTPPVVSTTAYGVYGDKIAGGVAQLGSGEQGYIYDMTTGKFTKYSAPGAKVTHFEGITGAGRAGEYNLVADWIGGDGLAHAGVLHLAADGTETWYELAVPTGAKLTITSANSIYQDGAIGVYVCKSKKANPNCGGGSHGYVLSIPGI